jgi:hypothetical protein
MPPFNTDKRDTRTQDIDVIWLADLLDTRWRIPGTQWRFGVDALAGLIPVVGDVVSGLAGVYILDRASRAGAGNGLLARMVGNLLLDTAVGSIPLIGSVFDIAFKANQRNLRLLGEHLAKQEGVDVQPPSARGL